MKKINGGFFDDDQGPSEDIMSEEEAEAIENGQEIQTEQYEDEISEEIIADLGMQSEEDQEDDDLENDAELVTNARLRLDQGRLYEMVIAHNFFDSVDANEKAIRNVQREIRNFAKERLEVLLGLKPDPKLSPVQTKVVQVQSQFSELETDLLKRLLSKMSNGTTDKVKEVPKAEPVKKITNTIPQIQQQQSKPMAMKSIAPVKAKEVAKPVPQKTAVKAPVQQKAAPQKRQPAPKEEAPLSKPVHLLTSKELMERNKRAQERQSGSKAVSAKAAPMPSVEQQEYLFANRQARNPQMATIQTLVSLVQQNKKTRGED